MVLQAVQGKFLGPSDHKVDEIATSCQTAEHKEICQDTEETGQMNVVILLTLLLLNNRLLWGRVFAGGLLHFIFHQANTYLEETPREGYTVKEPFISKLITPNSEH